MLWWLFGLCKFLVIWFSCARIEQTCSQNHHLSRLYASTCVCHINKRAANLSVRWVLKEKPCSLAVAAALTVRLCTLNEHTFMPRNGHALTARATANPTQRGRNAKNPQKGNFHSSAKWTNLLRATFSAELIEPLIWITMASTSEEHVPREWKLRESLPRSCML